MSWCFFPTPYHEFALGLTGPRSIWIKRDDLNGLAGGGNKTRKLRYYLDYIKLNGFDAVVTEGAPQSNHCRQTAAMGAANGLPVTLVLGGTGSKSPVGNVLLDELLGAQIIHTESARRQEVAENAMEMLRSQGFNPIRIPVGGSAPIGVEAYAAGVDEWFSQQEELDWLPDVIVHASSSGGTQAGLALGVARLNLNLKVLGISVDHTGDELRTIVESLIDATESDPKIASRAKDLALYNADYLGLGYARPGRAEAEAIELVARQTGILLDPVYSGRAMVGLKDMIESGAFDDQRLIFWHTGGMPSIHAFGRPASWPMSIHSGDSDERS
jgi:1-aminocyclopropane-1-carboxylate deaminase/D-cysteine desulfhydrase-like pyridoxal-dependent ACC family enzyme